MKKKSKLRYRDSAESLQTYFKQSGEQNRVGQYGHCVCKCLNDLIGQHSLYGSVIGSGPLCPLNRLMFSSALSNGLLWNVMDLFLISIRHSCNLKFTYFIQYSQAKYLHDLFHENWLDTNGTSVNIVSPFFKLVVANNARPCKTTVNLYCKIAFFFCNK